MSAWNLGILCLVLIYICGEFIAFQWSTMPVWALGISCSVLMYMYGECIAIIIVYKQLPQRHFQLANLKKQLIGTAHHAPLQLLSHIDILMIQRKLRLPTGTLLWVDVFVGYPSMWSFHKLVSIVCHMWLHNSHFKGCTFYQTTYFTYHLNNCLHSMINIPLTKLLMIRTCLRYNVLYLILCSCTASQGYWHVFCSLIVREAHYVSSDMHIIHAVPCFVPESTPKHSRHHYFQGCSSE